MMLILKDTLSYQVIAAVFDQLKAANHPDFANFELNPEPPEFIKIVDGVAQPMDLDGGDFLEEKDIIVPCFELVGSCNGDKYEVALKASSVYVVGKSSLMVGLVGALQSIDPW